MKKNAKLLIYFFVALMLISAAFTDHPEDELKEIQTTITPTPTIAPTVTVVPIQYDELQQLYFDIEETMSYSEVLDIVEESGLPYTDHKYNGSRAIKVAFTDKSAKQRHSDSGDHVTVSFVDNRTNDDNKYSFAYIEYFNSEKFVTVFYYLRGTYWKFYNCYDTGYFINDYNRKREDGYTITNTNGTTTETTYIKADTKEEQLEYIFNYVKE